MHVHRTVRRCDHRQDQTIRYALLLLLVLCDETKGTLCPDALPSFRRRCRSRRPRTKDLHRDIRRLDAFLLHAEGRKLVLAAARAGMRSWRSWPSSAAGRGAALPALGGASGGRPGSGGRCGSRHEGQLRRDRAFILTFRSLSL